MLQVNFNPFPLLTTERLVLRPMRADDADEVFFFRSDDVMMKYVGRAKAQSVDEAVKWIAMVQDLVAKNEGINWGISLRDDPKLIGNLGFWRFEKEHYRAEVGYVLHPDHQGKGIMAEALRAALDYGFNVMKLHSIEANIDPENTASKNLLERSGFVREAYFRENFFFDGVFYDSAIYCMLNPVK